MESLFLAEVLIEYFMELTGSDTLLRSVCERIAEGFQEQEDEKGTNDISNCDYNSEMGESDPEFDDGFEPNRVSFLVPTPKTKYQQISTLSKSQLGLK